MDVTKRNSLDGQAAEHDMTEINCKDITCIQDDWDIEEFVSKTCMGMFLYHPSFKILLGFFIMLNAVIIAMRTVPGLEEKYYGFFFAVDTIVLAFLICEVLLNWYYSFSLYWKDGWNILNFLIVAFLFIGLLVPELNERTVLHTFRIMRLIQVCTLVGGLARMIQVILKSAPDMVNIMVLLFTIMLVFSVFGVTLFGTLVPKHFGNLGTALYSLFICITQDGWVSIYHDFENEGLALEIGGAIYFFIFITFGAFIFANLLIAVVTTNLEQSMAAYHEEKQMQQRQAPLALSDAALDDGADDDLPKELSEHVHVKEVMQGTPMIRCQELLSFGNLSNLTEATCEELCVVLEAIHENLKEYRAIRDELDVVVQEVRSIKFNIEQEQEVILRNIRGAHISETVLGTEVSQGKAGDVLSTLMNLEKSKMIDKEYQKGAFKSAASRARRQSSSTAQELLEKMKKQRDTSPAEGSSAERAPYRRSSLSGETPDRSLKPPEVPGGTTKRSKKHPDSMPSDKPGE